MPTSTRPHRDATAPAPLSGRAAAAVLAVILLAAFMELLDATIVSVAAAAIAADLRAARPRCSGSSPGTRWPSEPA
ncbi:hypothetical protein ACFQU9_18035 [Actinomadura namibiensis]|uniref:hypothetical protein n=1 Tax=Actinomadura kijaniata TaxID=46161 RepID=UPI003605DB29